MRKPPADAWLHFIVAATIAFNLTIGIMAMVYLAMTKTPVPDQLDRLVTLMAGFLGGFLTKAGVDNAMKIVNAQNDPVPVKAK